MNPIYEPKGKAKEYGDYALNIYTGCPHRCYYCFAPSVLRRDREKFHTDVQPREKIVEATRSQLEKDHITGKTIHLCFTCDPYPTGYDTTPTREIIQVLKEHGNHVQILTKGDGSRDFDLLDGKDWYGITYDGSYGGIYMPSDRWADIYKAHGHGIKTWCSFEPVIDADRVLEVIENLFRHSGQGENREVELLSVHHQLGGVWQRGRGALQETGAGLLHQGQPEKGNGGPKMTRESAYQYLKKVYLTTKNDNYREALSVALAALRPVSREQVEKVWRGYWDHKEVISNKSITGKFLLPSCECSLCGCYVQQEVNFCPHCGAPMTDEAVEIRLKELEALKDGSTTD